MSDGGRLSVYMDVAPEVGFVDPNVLRAVATCQGSESLSWICLAAHVVSGPRLTAGEDVRQ